MELWKAFLERWKVSAQRKTQNIKALTWLQSSYMMSIKSLLTELDSRFMLEGKIVQKYRLPQVFTRQKLRQTLGCDDPLLN